MLSLFDLSELPRYLQVAFGIGLVIFVHEAGHFIAARLCRVRVETFSLGFGPRLFGWKRGPTTYQIAVVPLGGYVKMAGEERYDDRPPAPDDLRAKTVGQRFFIYSGGVLMNIAFGLVVFPIVLSVGVPFNEPVIREPHPGGPAWMARLAPGTRVLSVNDEPTFSFDSILNEVALSETSRVRLEVVAPGETTPHEIELDSVYVEKPGIRSIDVQPAFDAKGRVLVSRDSPAERAGLRSDDQLVALVGADPDEPLPEQLFESMQSGETLALEVERDGERRTVTVTPDFPVPKGPPRLGIEPAERRVRAVRDDPRATALGLRADDEILAVCGTPMVRAADFKRLLLAAGEGPCELDVRRGESIVHPRIEALDRAAALALAENIALAYRPDSTTVAVRAGTPAEAAGIRDGDIVLRVGGEPVDSWESVQREIKRAKPGQPLEIVVGRRSGDAVDEVAITAHPAPFPEPAYGFGLLDRMYTYQASGPAEAVRLGVKSTWKFMRDSWDVVRGIFRGSVSSENLGGIISISTLSYDWASLGLARLFFFLCMLSINLAFLNVLPIPVLDGGHLFFLIIEKIKGSPVSERVQGYSQMVGLVLIVSLMIYVTFNDIQRL